MNKKLHTPPSWLDKIIAHFIGKQHLDVIRGDLHEIYQNNVQQKGEFMASINYLTDVLSCLRSPLLEKRIQYKISFPMFNNYLKLSLRNLLRNKTFTIINISGLTLGFTISIIIFLFVRTELSYDKYHVNSDRIYRMNYDLTQRNEKKPWAITTGRWPELAHSELEPVEDFVRIIPSWGNKSLIKSGEKRFYESNFGWADPSLTRIFNFQFLEGDPETALNEPNTVIISRKIAEKYFGQSSAIGKSINRDDETDYLITGVIEGIPANSHFHLDFIASLMSATQDERARFWSYSYLLLKDGASPKKLEANLQGLLKKHSDKSKDARLSLLPLNDIHLKSDMMYEFEPNGDAKTIYIFSVIAVFILLIASINFINLSTAQSVKRVKEVGVRKVMGAVRNELIWQHLTESMTISFISFITALVLVKLSLPLINELTGTVIINDLFTNIPLILLIIFVAMLTGLLAGSYPAFFISSFSPNYIFRPSNTIKGNSLLRKILVVFQFSLSVFLIIGSITVYRQIKFFQNKNLGFSKEQVLAIPLRFADNI
ncbi:MAG: ABC transporter permease, partial [Ignavibacteria bacterium]|nr:ABC transporter permease [Ignavibacteria bacterium]